MSKTFDDVTALVNAWAHASGQESSVVWSRFYDIFESDTNWPARHVADWNGETVRETIEKLNRVDELYEVAARELKL